MLRPGSFPVILEFDAVAEIISTGKDPGLPRPGRDLRETNVLN